MNREETRTLAQQALARWKDDPVAFAYEALGVERIWPRQEELLRAVPKYRKVACKSGQKTSKTFNIALLSVWWALTHPRSNVLLLAPGEDHLQRNVWTYLTRLRQDSYNRSTVNSDGSPRRRAVMPLGGEFHKSAKAGWQFPNGSSIFGVVTNDEERLRGYSGPDQLYIIDEASALPDPFWKSVNGNLAGGGHVLAITNPVNITGWFFDAFHPANGKKSRWHQITISSIEASEVDPPIPGLATREYIEEMREEWGENHPEWFAKILGEFPPAGTGGVIDRGIVTAAQGRWTEGPTGTDRYAPLRIGIDPAHDGPDKTAIVWSRGKWSSEPIVLSGCNTVEVVRTVVDLIRRLRRGDEKAIVNVDGSSVGAGVYDQLREFYRDICIVNNLKAAESSPDDTCSRLRDALWIHLRKWLATGTMHPGHELGDDVCTPQLLRDDKLRFKVEDKRTMRRRIGRSTDRADALALAVWVGATRDDALVFEAAAAARMPRSNW